MGPPRGSVNTRPSWGFGSYVFWVPPSHQYLNVFVGFPREESEDGHDWADYEDRCFGVADRFVQELGWLG